MKRTNIVIDERVVSEAKKLTGIKTTRKLFDYALRELVRSRRQRRLLRYEGKVEWEGNLDEMRRGRVFE